MFTVDKTTWHYRMAERHKAFTNSWTMPTDFCRYWRSVMFGIMEFTSIAFIACAFAVFNVLGVVAMFLGAWNEFPLFAGINIVTGLLLCAVAGGLVMSTLVRKYHAYKYNNQTEKTGLLGTWYKSFKEKTCVQVEYK